MIKLVNKANNKVIAEVLTNHRMTTEEVLELVGIDLSECGDEGEYRDQDDEIFWIEDLEWVKSDREGQSMVKNSWGTEFDFDVTVNYMDDEIRERIHNELAPCTEQEFFDAYCKADKDWVFNEKNPVY